MYLFHQIMFKMRIHLLKKVVSYFRNYYFKFFGIQIGRNSFLQKCYITWPHQVKIGSNCLLEHNIHYKFEGIWTKGPSIIIGDNVFIGNGCEFNISQKILVGNNSLISSGCKFIDHDHHLSLEQNTCIQSDTKSPILIGNYVWLGCNVIILKGVSIQDGAVVGAGAVVTKSIGKNEIWAGVPAKKLGERK